MATVKSTLKLTSTTLTTDSLDVTVPVTLTGINTGGLHKMKTKGTAAGSKEKLLDATHFAAATHVYIKNCQSGTTDKINLEIGGAENMVIAPGEWAYFPWSATTDINVWGTTTLSVIEIGVFGA